MFGISRKSLVGDFCKRTLIHTCLPTQITVITVYATTVFSPLLSSCSNGLLLAPPHMVHGWSLVLVSVLVEVVPGGRW